MTPKLSYGLQLYDFLWEALCMIGVSMVWGCSNPFLKHGSEGIQRVRGSIWSTYQILLELWFPATRCSYTVLFLINQSGSVLYYLTVAKMDLSLAVPIINLLTVLFTTLVGLLLGEKLRGGRSLLGMACVLAGVALCLSAERT